MAYSLTVSHVDTCLPCYVQDHCNGETEMLIGVPVDRASRMHNVKQALADEARDYSDKFPDDLPDSTVAAAIGELFKGVHPLKAFNHSLGAAGDEMGESCYAWFRVEWESAE